MCLPVTVKNGFNLKWYFCDKVDAYKHAYVSTNHFYPDIPRGRGVATWNPTHVTCGVICVYAKLMTLDPFLVPLLASLDSHTHITERGVVR